MRSTSTTFGDPSPPFERAIPMVTRTPRRIRRGIGLIATPNHPEYPAAHGCFSGASTETLKYFFGADNVIFSVDSNVAGLINPIRTYGHFSDALAEVLEARIYGGMHYRHSTRIGANVGKQVSNFTTTHFFRPAKDLG